MKKLGVLGILCAAAGGVILSPVQFAPAIIIVSVLAAFAYYTSSIPGDFSAAERRLERQIESTQRKLFAIEKEVDAKISKSNARIEVIERRYDQTESRLNVNEEAIQGVTASLEQRYLRLEHDFLKKIVRIEQRLKSPSQTPQRGLSLVSTGLLAALAILIAIPLWWNLPSLHHKQAVPTAVIIAENTTPIAQQPEARAQLRAPLADREADRSPRHSVQPEDTSQVLAEVKDLLASTVRPLEKCVDQVTDLHAENKEIRERFEDKIQSLQSKNAACSSKLEVTRKIMINQREIWFSGHSTSHTN